MGQTDKPRVVVITGASAGIGRAIAREFARGGDHVALIARGKAGLLAAMREVRSFGGRALALAIDVSDDRKISRAASLIEEKLGPIDVWVNNAMVSVLSPAQEMEPNEYRRITEVTYLGYVWGTLAALRVMRPRNRGVIIQVGSALAYRAIPLQSAYCAAKHAIVGFTESLRSELIHDRSGIELCMVQLPGVNTPQFQWMKNRMGKKSRPVGTIFQPEVAARAVAWVADHPRRELAVGWPTIQAIAGDKLIPGVLDHHLARKVYREHLLDEKDDPGRPNNLFEPRDQHRDHGAHGPYDALATARSPALSLSKHRRWIGAAVAAAAAAAVIVSAIFLNPRHPAASV
jgi:NAD(P)-dependent dehydrogenase (short-subunit alcohol dehydrogenase family)